MAETAKPAETAETAKNPISRHETDCPVCAIDEITKNLRSLRRWVKEI